jgi:hypothetical protein
MLATPLDHSTAPRRWRVVDRLNGARREHSALEALNATLTFTLWLPLWGGDGYEERVTVTVPAVAGDVIAIMGVHKVQVTLTPE